MKLMIIWGSSRPARKGGPVANWVHTKAAEHFDVDFIDLKQMVLPFFDEPLSPFSMARGGQAYSNPAGKVWAERVAKANAVILVTPEYNHGPPAVLKNALDWIGPEWVDKPVGLISYGGVSGGTRAVEQLRSITIELGLVNVANAIHFPYFEQAFDESGQPKEAEKYNGQLTKMFNEIVRLHQALHKN